MNLPLTPLSTSRIAFVLLLFLLIIGFGWMTQLFWVPAGLAVVTVIVCGPIHNFISRRIRWRYLAAFFSLLVVCAFILLPLTAIAITIINEIIHFSQHIIERLGGGGGLASPLGQRLDELNATINSFLMRFTFLPDSSINLRELLVSGIKNLGIILYQFSPKVLVSTANIGISITFWLIFVFAFFAEGSRLYRFLVDISPLSAEHEGIMANEVRMVINATLMGMIATAFTNALLMTLMFWISPLDQAIVWGLITFGLSFIPIFGAFLIWAGGALYLFLIGELYWATIMAGFGLLIIAQTDNVIKPIVMRGHVNIHPILLLISIVGGIHMFGTSGLVFGPVFMAILLAALRIYHREFA